MIKNAIIILLIMILVFFGWDYINKYKSGEITNFNECARAGNPIFESHPRQCKINGETFMEEVEEDRNVQDESTKKDLDEVIDDLDKEVPDSEDEINKEGEINHDLPAQAGDKSTSTSDLINEIEEEDKDVVIESDEIKVFDIEPGSTLTSPIEIKGEGVAFESTLIVELRNSNHEALVQEIANIKSPDVGMPGSFKITINFSFQNTKEGFLAVYEESAKDGSEQHLVEIPVKFSTDIE